MTWRWLVIAAAVIQGCASNQPVSKYTVIAPDSMAAIHGNAVRIKASPTPDFLRTTNADQATMTIGMFFGAVGGGIGAAAAIAHMRSAGHAVVTDNAIPDPTQQLMTRIKAILTSKYGSSVGDSQYELDIATDSWALAKDDVLYVASVKVIDENAKPPHLLATGQCRFNTIGDKTRLSADQLLDNHAENLKLVLDRALDQCIKDFDEKVFL